VIRDRQKRDECVAIWQGEFAVFAMAYKAFYLDMYRSGQQPMASFW
jgi:hypothetical protein